MGRVWLRKSVSGIMIEYEARTWVERRREILELGKEFVSVLGGMDRLDHDGGWWCYSWQSGL